jgi:heme-degrading monooxygenase HmoA
VFAHALELTTRPGKLREVIRILREAVMPMLREQPGFVEEFILASDAEPDRLLALTLWTRHEHADWVHRHHSSKIRHQLEPLLEFEPVTRTFNVENGQAPAPRLSRPSPASRPRPRDPGRVESL